MKNFSLLLICFIFVGCTTKIVEPAPIVVTETIEKKVPVYCSVPKVTCEFKSKDKKVVIQKMMDCIIRQKRALNVCSENNMIKYIDSNLTK